MLTAVIAVVIVAMLCMPINAITFRSKSLYKAASKIISKIKDHVNSVIDRFSSGKLKNGVKACRVRANKISASLKQFSPLVLAAGDGNETNGTSSVLRAPITTGLENENHPSLVSLGNGKYFLAYESDNPDLNGKEILFTYSTDNGKSWTSPVYFALEGNQTYTQIDSFDRGNVIGVCLSDYFYYNGYKDFNRSHLYILNLLNPFDDSTWSYWPFDLWNLSDGKNEYRIENISALSLDLRGNNEILISVVGDVYNKTAKKWEVKEGPIIVYTDEYSYNSDELSLWFVWFEGNTSTCSIPATALNEKGKNMFIAYQKKNNSSSEIFCLYSKTGDISNWSMYNLSMNGKNLSTPSAIIKDGKIYIAIESTDGTDTNIILYKSQNGVNWTRYNISTKLNISEKYPVLYSNSTHLICVYYNESKDIYLRTSPDGENWSNAFDINNGTGTVVEEYQTADIADSKHIVWTDNRDGNKDLWIAILGEKEEKKGKPKLNIVNINLESSEKNMNASNVINITYSNTGDENATMVQLFVTSQCIIDGKPRLVNITENSAYIPVIPKNTTKYIRLQWFTIEPPWKWMMEYLLKEFLNKGEYPPTVKYMNITEIIVQLGPCLESNKTVTASIPVTWDEIFGNLWDQALILAEPVKAGGFFNVTVLTKNGQPVSNAIVIWPTPSLLSVFYKWFIKGSFSTSDLSTLTRIGMRKVGTAYMFTTFFKEILKAKIWKLPIKFRYKLILSLLSTLFHPRRVIKIAENGLLATTLLLASSSYITDGNGKVQLMAPSLAINIPRPLIVFSYEHKCLGIEMITVED